MCVADAANWGNIELAGTNPTYRPPPHRCESHITSHSSCNRRTINVYMMMMMMMCVDTRDQNCAFLLLKN